MVDISIQLTLNIMKTRTIFSYLVSLTVILGLFSCQNQQKAPSINEVLEKTLSSVVTIKTTSSSVGKTVYGLAGSEVASVAYEKMLQMGDASGSGSGFVINYNGKKYLITNAHVIEKVDSPDGSISAFSYSRNEYPLRLIGGDSFYDIAVLEFAEGVPQEITTLDFSSGEYRVGDPVYAIGNPLGYLPYTVTQGIISAINRPGYTARTGYLQTTAMLTGGNSGGPLINIDGDLVGINTFISSDNRQLNFALESKTIKHVIEDIITYGRVKRAFLGLEIVQDYKYYSDENENWKVRLIDEVPRINEIMPNSPAGNVLDGMKDAKIVKANGSEIASIEDLLNIFELVKPTDTIILTLEQNNIRKEYSIVADELTHQKLGDIASYYFKVHYEIELTTSDKGYVILTYPYKGYRNNTFQYLDRQNRFKRYIPKGEQAYIVAIGNSDNIEDESYWRVTDLSTFGSGLRLSALNGQIVFMDYNGRDAYLVRILLSNKKDIVSKTLLN